MWLTSVESWLKVQIMSVVRKCNVLALQQILRELDKDIMIRHVTINLSLKVDHYH